MVANWILNDSRPIESSTIDVDQAADDELTGFRTRFEKDLRPGDVVTPTFLLWKVTNTLRVKRVDPTAIGVTANKQKIYSCQR